LSLWQNDQIRVAGTIELPLRSFHLIADPGRAFRCPKLRRTPCVHRVVINRGVRKLLSLISATGTFRNHSGFFVFDQSLREDCECIVEAVSNVCRCREGGLPAFEWPGVAVRKFRSSLPWFEAGIALSGNGENIVLDQKLREDCECIVEAASDACRYQEGGCLHSNAQRSQSANSIPAFLEMNWQDRQTIREINADGAMIGIRDITATLKPSNTAVLGMAKSLSAT
jgi:hypothetical protein